MKITIDAMQNLKPEENIGVRENKLVLIASHVDPHIKQIKAKTNISFILSFTDYSPEQ
jgi:hypothetical protein